MTVSIVPLGNEGSEVGRYSEELRVAIRAVDMLRPVEMPSGSAETVDVIHVVASDSTMTADAIAPFRARCGALVLTLLPTDSDGTPMDPSVARALDAVVYLTDACLRSAQRDWDSAASAHVVPCAVPAPVGVRPPKSPDEPPEVVLMWPRPTNHAALKEAMLAVGELPRGSTLTAAYNGDGVSAARALSSTGPGIASVADRLQGASDGTNNAVERMILEMAKHLGLAERIRAVPCSTEADVHAQIARADAVVAVEPICAGPWNGLAALAHGRPLLAADRTIFRDLMLRAGCVRLLRFDQPGHLAACLRALFSNELGLRELRERGAAYGATHHWHAVACRMANIYAGALSAVSARRIR